MADLTVGLIAAQFFFFALIIAAARVSWKKNVNFPIMRNDVETTALRNEVMRLNQQNVVLTQENSRYKYRN